MKHFRVALIASLAGFSTVSLAATDGTLGATSSGTSAVGVTKTAAVMVTGIDDYAFVTDGIATADEVLTNTLCVHSSGGLYNVTLTSANTDGTAFRMISGTDFLEYAVAWDDLVTGAVPAPTTNGTAITAQNGSQVDTDCSTNGDNATLELTLVAATYNAARAGSYTDTLTIAIAPE